MEADGRKHPGGVPGPRISVVVPTLGNHSGLARVLDTPGTPQQSFRDDPPTRQEFLSLIGNPSIHS